MVDPLADWWVHTVLLERMVGAGAYGDVFADPVQQACLVSDKTRMVRDREGVEVVSSTSVALPSSVGFVAPGSRVTVPGVFGGRVAVVVACSVGDAGSQPTPNHVDVALE